jgi:hypothetical protein
MAQYKEITMNGKYALVVEGAKKSCLAPMHMHDHQGSLWESRKPPSPSLEERRGGNPH